MKCSTKYYSPHIILTCPINVYPPTNVRKIFVPTKFWQIFKLSSPIIMGEIETMITYVTYIRTPTFTLCMILDTHLLTHTLNFFQNFFKVFDFLWFLCYTIWKPTAINLTFNWFVCPWNRRFLYCLQLIFKKLYFSIFHANYSINIYPHLRALAKLGCL